MRADVISSSLCTYSGCSLGRAPVEQREGAPQVVLGLIERAELAGYPGAPRQQRRCSAAVSLAFGHARQGVKVVGDGAGLCAVPVERQGLLEATPGGREVSGALERSAGERQRRRERSRVGLSAGLGGDLVGDAKGPRRVPLRQARRTQADAREARRVGEVQRGRERDRLLELHLRVRGPAGAEQGAAEVGPRADLACVVRAAVLVDAQRGGVEEDSLGPLASSRRERAEVVRCLALGAEVVDVAASRSASRKSASAPSVSPRSRC